MEGAWIAEYLNLLSAGGTIYSFDERLNKVLSITKDMVGSTMSVEQAYNELYSQATMMLLNLQMIFDGLKQEKLAQNIATKG